MECQKIKLLPKLMLTKYTFLPVYFNSHLGSQLNIQLIMTQTVNGYLVVYEYFCPLSAGVFNQWVATHWWVARDFSVGRGMYDFYRISGII